METCIGPKTDAGEEGALTALRTGGHIWAERFDRELDDIFAIQDEITREIVAVLSPALSPEPADAAIPTAGWRIIMRCRQGILAGRFRVRVMPRRVEF